MNPLICGSVIIGTVTTLAIGLGAAPAVAADTDTTTVTFEILAGTLDIDAPAAADLGTGPRWIRRWPGGGSPR